MFNASNFTYDGIFSEQYGLKIATLDASTLERTTYVSPTISTAKPARSKKFFYQGVDYANAPTMQFSVVSQEPLSDILQSEILTWLEGRKGFKKLTIHQAGLDDFYYNCIFTVSEIIYFAGYCIGFNLTANFDSPYMYGKSTVITKTGTGTTALSVDITNKSTTRDEYVYPKVVFTTTSYLSGTKNISIFNTTDDVSREFTFSGISTNNTVTVDNELKIISATSGTDLLSKFNKNWLRLRPGKNTLSIKLNGQITITCPHYEKIRF